MTNKTPLTVNERKRLERSRKRDRGFKKKETWVHESDEKTFDEFVNKLKKP